MNVVFHDVVMRLRSVGFERRVAIAFAFAVDRVVFLRVFDGHRDWKSDSLPHRMKIG